MSEANVMTSTLIDKLREKEQENAKLRLQIEEMSKQRRGPVTADAGSCGCFIV